MPVDDAGDFTDRSALGIFMACPVRDKPKSFDLAKAIVSAVVNLGKNLSSELPVFAQSDQLEFNVAEVNLPISPTLDFRFFGSKNFWQLLEDLERAPPFLVLGSHANDSVVFENLATETESWHQIYPEIYSRVGAKVLETCQALSSMLGSSALVLQLRPGRFQLENVTGAAVRNCLEDCRKSEAFVERFLKSQESEVTGWVFGGLAPEQIWGSRLCQQVTFTVSHPLASYDTFGELSIKIEQMIGLVGATCDVWITGYLPLWQAILCEFLHNKNPNHLGKILLPDFVFGVNAVAASLLCLTAPITTTRILVIFESPNQVRFVTLRRTDND